MAGKGKKSSCPGPPFGGAPPFRCLFFHSLFFPCCSFFFLKKKAKRLKHQFWPKSDLAKVGQLRMAKVGLAKVGFSPQILVSIVGIRTISGSNHTSASNIHMFSMVISGDHQLLLGATSWIPHGYTSQLIRKKKKQKPIILSVGLTVTTVWETWHPTEVGLPAGNGAGVLVKSAEGRSCLRVLDTRFWQSALSCEWLTHEALTFVFCLVNLMSLACLVNQLQCVLGSGKSFKDTPEFVSTSTSLKIVRTSLTEEGAPFQSVFVFSPSSITKSSPPLPPSHAVLQQSKNRLL